MAQSDGSGLGDGWAPLFGPAPDAGISPFGGAPALPPLMRTNTPGPSAPPIVAPQTVPLLRPLPYAFGDAAPASAPAPAPPVPVENGHTLGLAILLSGIGGAIGAKYGGFVGGAAGVLYGGALMNLIRAGRNVIQGTPEADKEAAVSATWAVISAGVATYMWTKGAKTPGHATPNDGDDEEEETSPEETEPAADEEEEEEDESA